MEPITTGNIEKSIYWFTDFDWFLSLIYSLCLCNAPQKKVVVVGTLKVGEEMMMGTLTRGI